MSRRFLLLRYIPNPTRRGAASLVVVMVLFFIITLVAAYTSRNLLFEQRTSTNQYRSTLAFEAAEAGVEWALARLNDARMNNDCTPLTTAGAVSTQVSFRDRYLSIDPTTGVVTPAVGPVAAGCIFNGSSWVCDCPATGNPNPTVTYTGNGPFAAFWVRFVTVTGTAPGVTGVVRMQVNSCTRADASCLSFTREAQPGDGLATVWSMIALRSALTTSPAAALTASGAVAYSGGLPNITNTDSTSGGLTVNSGSTIAAGLIPGRLTTIPGSPREQSVSAGDPALAFLTLAPTPPADTRTNLMFNSVFGMWPATHFAQPGLATVDCSASCSATEINDAVLLNPGHVIRISDGGGTGTLQIGANIGTAAAPVIIVADPGINVVFAAGTNVFSGVIYSRSANWQLGGGNGTIQGAAIAEQAFDFNNADPSIIYDRDVLLRVRNLNGSFVKVPGGWRDFQP